MAPFRSGTRDGAVVRALASHWCGPLSNPGVDANMWVEFVVGSLLCSERFFSGYSCFLLLSKTNTSKFQFDQESGRGRTSLWMCFLHIIVYWLNVYIYLWQLWRHCNPCHNKFPSLSNQERSNTTVVAMFPNLCFWRRSLSSNFKGIDPEISYRATLKGPLIKMFQNDAPYGSIISVYKKLAKITRELFVLAILLLSRYVEGVIFFNVINPEKLPLNVPDWSS